MTVAEKIEALRALYASEGGPTNLFAFKLWCAELPFAEEKRILDALRAGGWELVDPCPLPSKERPAFVRLVRPTGPRTTHTSSQRGPSRAVGGEGP